MIPPGLAWLPLFSASTGLALDQHITTEARGTVNQLVYIVTVRWAEPISKKNAVLVWNLFQKWAGKNGATPEGSVEMFWFSSPAQVGEEKGTGFEAKLHIRERLGLPKTAHP